LSLYGVDDLGGGTGGGAMNILHVQCKPAVYGVRWQCIWHNFVEIK